MNISRLVAGAVAGVVLLAPNIAHGQADPTPPEIMLLHAIPGVDMDVLVDGEVLIPDFAPGDMQDLSAFAGQTLIDLELRVSATGRTAFGPVPEFEVPAAGSWTVVAHLDEDETPVITPYENEQAETEDGQGRLTLHNVAAAPAVDLVLGGVTEIEGASNGSTEHVNVPAGELTDGVITDAAGDEIAALPVLDIAAGENLILHVVRSPLDDTFEFYVQGRRVGAAPPAPPADADEATGDDATEDDATEDDATGGATVETPAGDTGDGTPAPTSVQTGDALATGGLDPLMLLAIGFAAMAGMAVAAFHLSRRTY